MKNNITLLVIALMFVTTISKAQIPNQSFENWDNMGSYSNPSGWGTMNDLTSVASVFTAENGTPGTQGSSCLKLTSKTTPLGVVSAIAVSGKLDTITQQPISGFAYTNRPAELTGMLQYMAFSGTGFGSISITLTKWNTTALIRDTVGSGFLSLAGMQMSWANFAVPITYTLPDNPDSCVIVLKASGTPAINNNYLWVDNLNLTGMPMKVNDVILDNLNVYPNPSIDEWIIRGEANSKQIKMVLYNLFGEVVYQTDVFANGTFTKKMDTRHLVNGVYTLQLKTNTAQQYIKLIKAK